jgi:hypothetical protein
MVGPEQTEQPLCSSLCPVYEVSWYLEPGWTQRPEGRLRGTGQPCGEVRKRSYSQPLCKGYVNDTMLEHGHYVLFRLQRAWEAWPHPVPA